MEDIDHLGLGPAVPQQSSRMGFATCYVLEGGESIHSTSETKINYGSVEEVGNGSVCSRGPWANLHPE